MLKATGAELVIAIVMPKSSWVRFLCGTVAVLLLVLLGVLVATSNRVPRAFGGCIIKLERYTFRSGVVRYYLLDEQQDRTMARKIANALPQPITQRLKWILPKPKAYEYSDFPNEPFLSVAFSTQGAGNHEIVSRVIVSDDRGQTFDGVVNYMGNSSILKLQPFPRRGTKLYLRPMMSGNDSGVVFTIPNPCPGPHPVWRAQPLPIRATNSTLQVTLERFIADRAQARTRCTLRVQEGGRESTAWLPASFEIFDATGNHWKPCLDGVQSTNGLFNCSFFGALWPDEDAWRVHVDFKRGDKQPGSGGGPCAVEFWAKPEQVGNAPPPGELEGKKGAI